MGVRFCVKSDFEPTKQIVDTILINHGFALNYSDPFNCIAERGSKGATIILGAFAGKKKQHLKFGINYSGWDQGGQVVSVNLANTGMAGGVIGVSRAQDAFAEITAAMRGSFMQQEILAGETQF